MEAFYGFLQLPEGGERAAILDRKWIVYLIQKQLHSISLNPCGDHERRMIVAYIPWHLEFDPSLQEGEHPVHLS